MAAAAMNPVRYLARLGYGSRRQVQALLDAGRFTANGVPIDADGPLPDHAMLRFDGEPLDPPPGVVVLLHKPTGYVCSHRDAGRLVFDVLPTRWRAREPALSTVGRLDRDTSGLLLLTDDGALLHRIISPRAAVRKCYEAELAEDLREDVGALFASGTLMLDSETRPLLPAQLEVLEPRRVRVTVHEGRYHQVRRMFAAVGNRVETLHRVSIGGLGLGELPPGRWRLLEAGDIATVFA